MTTRPTAPTALPGTPNPDWRPAAPALTVCGMFRALIPVVATGLAALSLSACTSNTQSCKDGVCNIDLQGKNSVVVLGGDGGSELKLLSASGKTAKVQIGKTKGTLTVDEPVGLTNASLVLVKVEGEDDIQLKLDTRGYSQDGSTKGSTPSGSTPGTSPN